jgi:tetratricopeptide (TPR) repeat protein
MIYLMLIHNEDRDDEKSQALIVEIRFLQDKLHDKAHDSSQVALSLSSIGSLLFSMSDLDNALVFFLEELRLEEQLREAEGRDDDIRISMTCNNLGQVYQKLELYDKAILYFERALSPFYGGYISHKTVTAEPRRRCHPMAASMISAVWYNLGLIHYKRRSCTEALCAFKMSLHLRKSLVGSNPADVACLCFNIGVLLMEEGRLDESQTFLNETLRARSHCQITDQLNDKQVTATLTKLATLYKGEGKIQSAIDVLIAVYRVLKLSTEFDSVSRMTGITNALCSISELYHAMDELPSALATALESVKELEIVATQILVSDILQNPPGQGSLVEQIMSSLLLVGSLHYEMCEPIRGDTCARQAVSIFQTDLEANSDLDVVSSSSSSGRVESLRDVALLVVTAQCAPVA